MFSLYSIVDDFRVALTLVKKLRRVWVYLYMEPIIF